MSKFEITDYYELLALHKAIHSARFATTPLIPYLPGSPYLAEIARRVVVTLAEMEVERGHPERASEWQMPIDPSGEVWRIAVRNAADQPDQWNSLSEQEKLNRAATYLSPFSFSDELAQEFVRQVTAKASS